MLKKVAMFAVVLGLAAPVMAQTEEAGKAHTEEAKAKDAHAAPHATKKVKAKKKADAKAETAPAAEAPAPAAEAPKAP